MRPLLCLTLVAPLLAACTPYLPMRSDFGVSAATPKGDIPPEFAAFNAYDPTVSPILATQLCATAFEPRETAAADAEPGQLVTTRGTCATHRPIIGN